jgi:hypothetical protein
MTGTTMGAHAEYVTVPVGRLARSGPLSVHHPAPSRADDRRST